MGVENLLFHIDTLSVDGVPVAFADGSGMISGAARYQSEVVPSASGDDYTKRKRVPTFFKCKIQFGNAVDPKVYTGIQGVQITARDKQSGRRALMPKCSFGEMGEVGGGEVDVTFNVLSEIQWL
jgi:hypothetical protein